MGECAKEAKQGFPFALSPFRAFVIPVEKAAIAPGCYHCPAGFPSFQALVSSQYIVPNELRSERQMTDRNQPDSGADRADDEEGHNLVEVEAIAGWTFDRQRREVRLGGRSIRLTNIEFFILRHLAARPYWAYTRRQIARAVCEALGDQQAIAEEDVDEHVISLRDKLGMLSDYVQSVPYIGYRFKE